MACITDNELTELLEGRLPRARRQAVALEVATCASCRQLVRTWFSSSPSGAGSPPAALDGAITVAGYVVGEVLGAGAGGIVVRARDVTLDRDVALKLMRTRGDSGSAYADALREARTLATVRHPAVIAVYAAGTTPDFAYLAMELVLGASLAARVARRPLDWRVAVTWFAAAAAGLEAIHAEGLVHRDLKPANLLVDGDRLRIADFGLATRAGAAAAGTLPYLAPEVLAGGAADPQADIYSLFASLFEAIAGRPPYPGADHDTLRAAALRGVLQWPRRVPARVRAVIERGLAPSRDARWPDAAAARAALLELAERPRRRRRMAIAAMAATVAAIAAAGGGVVWARQRQADARGSCGVVVPAWSTLAVIASAGASADAVQRIAHRLIGYQQQLAAVSEVACATGDTPRAAAQAQCLRHIRERVDAIVGTLGPSAAAVADGEHAVMGLPAPAYCASWRLAAADDPRDSAALAAAQAQLDLGEPQRALDQLVAVAPESPLAADAELVRGNAKLRLSDGIGAADAFRAALERAATAGRDDVVIDADLGLALAVGFHQHEPAAGEAYAESARAAAIQTGDERGVALARNALGLLAAGRGDMARARSETEAALGELAPLDLPLQSAHAEMQLVMIARRAGDLTTARVHFERAHALCSNALGADHPDTLLTEMVGAGIDAADGHADRSLATMHRVIDRLAGVYGPASAKLAEPLTQLGLSELAHGDFTAADASLSRALALQRTARGERNLEVARAYLNLASLRYQTDRTGDAVELYRAALSSARSVLGDDHPEVAPMLYGLGIALAADGRNADAQTELAHAIAVYRAHPGHDAALADALSARANLERRAGQLDDARRDHEDAIAIFERLHGRDHVASTWALEGLGEVELDAGKLDRAITLLERTIAIRSRASAPAVEIARVRLVLARALWRAHRPAEARAAAVQARGEVAPETQTGRDIAAWLAMPH